MLTTSNRKYWNTCSIPFQNLTSLRAHFIHVFDHEGLKLDDVDLTDEVDLLHEVSSKDETSSISKTSTFVFLSEEQKSLEEVANVQQGQTKYELDDVESGLEFISFSEAGSSINTVSILPGFTSDSGNNSIDVTSEKTIEASFSSLESSEDIVMPESIMKAVSVELLTTSCLGQAGNVIKGKNESTMHLIKPLLNQSVLWNKIFWKSSDDSVCAERYPTSSESEKKYSPDTDSLMSVSSPEQSSDLISESGSKSSVSNLKSISPGGSLQSLPSSPLKGKISVKKLTSESFSSENDISRSLEIVYVQPENDPKEQLKAQYRTVSPVPTMEKVEKRKASFTQLKRPSSQEPGLEFMEKENLSDVPLTSSVDHYDMPKAISADFTPYISDIDPLTFKKPPSPTKILTPVITSSPVHQQLAEDKFSPVFEIHSKTPLRSPEKKFEYVEGKKITTVGTCC